jgi:hypothetical protein
MVRPLQLLVLRSHEQVVAVVDQMAVHIPLLAQGAQEEADL